MKVAEVLVVGADPSRVARLRDVTSVSPEGLQPYQDEIRAVETMYASIWQFHAFLDLAFFDKQPLVAWALEQKLGFPNDQLLAEELGHTPRGSIYHVLIGELKGEIAPARLPAIVRRMDENISLRMRHGKTADLKEQALRAIREVDDEASASAASVRAREERPQGKEVHEPSGQLGIPGMKRS